MCTVNRLISALFSEYMLDLKQQRGCAIDTSSYGIISVYCLHDACHYTMP